MNGAATRNGVAELPTSTRIHFIQEALTRERAMRQRALKGSDRDKKVQEMEICLSYLLHVEQALQRAKAIIANHKKMCGRLRECADRHGLDVGEAYLDQVVIAALDKLGDGI